MGTWAYTQTCTYQRHEYTEKHVDAYTNTYLDTKTRAHAQNCRQSQVSAHIQTRAHTHADTPLLRDVGAGSSEAVRQRGSYEDLENFRHLGSGPDAADNSWCDLQQDTFHAGPQAP